MGRGGQLGRLNIPSYSHASPYAGLLLHYEVVDVVIVEEVVVDVVGLEVLVELVEEVDVVGLEVLVEAEDEVALVDELLDVALIVEVVVAEILAEVVVEEVDVEDVEVAAIADCAYVPLPMIVTT
jgi:hypothetical protein